MQTASEVFDDDRIQTEELLELAGGRVLAEQQGRKSTFVPVFLTNECDSSCRMCGMRKENSALIRQTASREAILEQLEILMHGEGVRRVGFLTGEYASSYTRLLNVFFVGWCIRTAFDLGFEEVYFNIGHFTAEEAMAMGEWVNEDEPAVMCVFQETYDHRSYDRFMSSTKRVVSPKADYGLRHASFDHWIAAGHSYVNLGILIGVNPTIGEDLDALIEHAQQLTEQGARVRLSVPRLRPALETSSAKSKVSDDTYVRSVAALALAAPEMPIVITTREDRELQHTLLPVVGVFSPGSPDVAPYKRDAAPSNDESSSQFIIPDVRRPSAILGDASDSLGVGFEGWAPPTPAASPS